MIVGPTGGGKSVVINTLVKAQTTMGITTKCITLNPKVRQAFLFISVSPFCVIREIDVKKQLNTFEDACEIA